MSEPSTHSERAEWKWREMAFTQVDGKDFSDELLNRERPDSRSPSSRVLPGDALSTTYTG